MREAFGCGFYPGPDQQLRSNKTVYGNAVWQRLQQPNDLAISTATRSKQEQQQTPTRSRQGHHALGIDGKLLMELLGAALNTSQKAEDSNARPLGLRVPTILLAINEQGCRQE